MDISIIIIYFLLLIFIGSKSFRAVKGINGFLVADRRGTVLFISGSLFATIIGGSATIGMAGLGYQMGLVGSWWLLVGSIGLLLLGFFLAERVRRYALYTLPEILEIQYGIEAKLFASVLILFAWMGIIAGQIVAAGKILEIVFKIPSTYHMIITTLVLITYTLLGGQLSVVRTDTIQALIIFIAILLLIPLCLAKAGGIETMIETLGREHFSFPVNRYFTWKSWVTYMILIGSTYLVGPDMYSRLFCTKDEKTARRASIIVALIIIPFAFFITIIGMSARVLFPQINPEASFPTLISHLFPLGISGLVIAALLSAVMSSADTCLMTTSTILTMDIVKNLARRPISEKGLILLSRLFIIVIGLLSLLVAIRLKGVIPSLLLGYTVYTSGLVLPILFGFFQHRLQIHRIWAIMAMVSGGGVALVGKLTGWTDFGLYGFCLSGLILLTGSGFIFLKPQRPNPETTGKLNHENTKGRKHEKK